MRRFLFVLLAFIATISVAQAREVYILNNSWRLFFKEENSSDNARFVNLPHTWNTDALSEGGSLRQTTAYYRRTLFVPSQWQGKRLFLRFGGVMSVADVFVNGGYVGNHKGGRTAFTFEITDKVQYGSENTLLVEVSNAYRSDVLPTSSEMNNYGGIYRDVELIITGQTTVSPLFYGSEGVIVVPTKVNTESVEGNISVALTSKREQSCEVTLDIVSPDGYVAVTKTVKAKCDGKLLNIPFAVSHPELWSTFRPSLYRVDVMVGADTVSVTTGFRRIEVSPEQLLQLNGKRLAVRGVNLCHDNVRRGNALTEADYVADIKAINDLGANAVRSVEGPHAQTLYDICDREGMLAWIDLPLVQSPFLSDMAYYNSPDFESNGKQQLQEIIYQNIHHPSVAMWGVFSLLRGRSAELISYVKELNSLAKKIDPSRLTVACSNQDGDINFITDLIVWQQSVGWNKGDVEDLKLWQSALRSSWSHLRQGVCYGEGGTKGHYNEELISRTSSQHRIPESWQTRFHEGYVSRIDNTLFWGVWLNTMFDFGAVRHPGGFRNSGLVSFDHSQNKDAYYLYRTLWNRTSPTLHIVGKNREVRMRNRQVIKVYCSQGVPTLTINGENVNMRNCSQGIFVTDSLTMSGFNTVIATTPNLRDSTTFTIGNYLKRR
ncbi:MAG: beta-galactosidase [Alistipes sp.]|nr:beta-galactosidase [Alistipes sp.]MBQ9138975.1 beta-galactosidase [Alistipes sp.]